MSTIKPTTSAPLFYFNGYSIEATYSFSAYSVAKATKSKKVWLDMVFKHPLKGEPVTVRSARSSMILYQPKEVIDAIAQRDIRDFLTTAL